MSLLVAEASMHVRRAVQSNLTRELQLAIDSLNQRLSQLELQPCHDELLRQLSQLWSDEIETLIEVMQIRCQSTAAARFRIRQMCLDDHRVAAAFTRTKLDALRYELGRIEALLEQAMTELDEIDQRLPTLRRGLCRRALLHAAALRNIISRLISRRARVRGMRASLERQLHVLMQIL